MIGLVALVLFIAAAVWIFGLNLSPIVLDAEAVVHCVLGSLHTCPQ